jgi:hypothetical protein
MRKQLLSWVCGSAALVALTVCGSARAAHIELTQYGPAPGPAFVGGGWDGAYLNLTQPENSLNNQAAFPEVVAGPYQKLMVDFDFRISAGNGGGADGVGFVYAESSLHNTHGPVPSFSEEANLAGSLGVGFDTFNNTDLGDGGENSVSLHFNGAVLGNFVIDGSAIPTFENSEVNHAKITVVPGVGGSNVSVAVTNQTSGNTINPFTDFFVPGLTAYDGRMVFNARTGGANSQQDIDNVVLTHMAGGNDPTTTVTYSFVPEPGSLTLAGLAAGLLALARRRR